MQSSSAFAFDAALRKEQAFYGSLEGSQVKVRLVTREGLATCPSFQLSASHSLSQSSPTAADFEELAHGMTLGQARALHHTVSMKTYASAVRREEPLASPTLSIDAEDVAPRTPLPAATQETIEQPELMSTSSPSSLSPPSSTPRGNSYCLLCDQAVSSPAFAHVPATASQYLAATQQLASKRGLLFTYAASLTSVVPALHAAATSLPAAEPMPPPLNEDWQYWHFRFSCIEAAAKLGLRATYTQVTAGL